MLHRTPVVTLRRFEFVTPSWVSLRRFGEKLLFGDELIRKPVRKKGTPPIQRIPATVQNLDATQTSTVHTNSNSPKQLKISEQLYTELGSNDPRLCDSIETARGRRCAEPNNVKLRTIVLEGERLICDALASGGRVQTLYFSSRNVLQTLDSTERIENIFYVPHRILKQFSALKTCPGLMAIVEIPDPALLVTRYPLRGLWRPLPITLVLNGIRDPGNMGSLLRTATSFGLSSVLVSKGSVDIWNEKVVRAGMSAHFRIPVYQDLSWPEIGERIRDEAVQLVGRDKQDRVKVFVADVASAETEKRIAECSKLEAGPMPIIGSDVALDDVNDEDFEATFSGSFQGFLSSPDITAFRLPLSSAPHFRVDYFSTDPILNDTPSSKTPSEKLEYKPVLVVGSEATGLSPEAYYLAHLTGGSRIVIPSAPDTDSLNVVSATSVILGEMQRQYLNRYCIVNDNRL